MGRSRTGHFATQHWIGAHRHKFDVLVPSEAPERGAREREREN